MENHPIPQDITGFQFKLIGNMTIKQFAYLAAGTVLAWFCFFILPVFIIIRLPLAIIFLGLSISLAFVPVDGRPMDTMIINLIKAIFAPTQYIYKKTGGNLATAETLKSPQKTQSSAITTLPPPFATPAITSPAASQQAMVSSPQAQKAQPEPLMQTPGSYGKVVELPDSSPRPVLSGNLDDLVNEKPFDVAQGKQEEEDKEKILENEKKLEEEVDSLEEQLEEAKALENTETNLANLSSAHQKTAELEKLLIETSRQKEALEKELLTLKAKLDGQGQQKFDPSLAKPLPQTQRVRKVPPGMEKSVGLPSAPLDPNLITGIVKDPRGNPLPNILVEVKDTDDSPVRAFKTNGLGQFAAATSLTNGKYIVSSEDPGGAHKFDAVEIEATGAPIMPLEITSVDPREELRRELFN